MTEEQKSNYVGMAGALLIHLLIVVLLLLISFRMPERQEESGIPVMLGEMPDAEGDADPNQLTEVDILPDTNPEVSTPNNVPEPPVEQKIITQEQEETVAMKPQKKPVEKKPIKKEKTAEQIAAEQKRQAKAAAAERERLAKEQAEKERRAAAEATAKRVSGAFGKGTQMGNKGTTSGNGVQGVPTGNSSTGAMSGSAGYGTFDLGGRSIGTGGLPRPAYNVQDEGRVVVSIVVNPSGQVISTRIHPQTNTVNASLRRAAEEAARKARFNSVEGTNNQSGTITYHFKLK